MAKIQLSLMNPKINNVLKALNKDLDNIHPAAVMAIHLLNQMTDEQIHMAIKTYNCQEESESLINGWAKELNLSTN